MTTKGNKKPSGTNVVTLRPTEEQEARPSLQEILDMLVEMDDVEYDRCRVIKAAEWGLQQKTLDTA